MEYAEVCTEVCDHGCLPSCSNCHVLRTAPNEIERETSHLTSTNYSSAKFKEHPDGGSMFRPNTKHVPDKTADGSISHLNPPAQLKVASSKATRRSDVKSTAYSVMTSTSSCNHTQNHKCSYQLQRYLKEPAGYGARLFVGAAPTQRCMDLLHSRKRSGKQDKEMRKAAMGKKIRAIEKKISRL